MVRLESDGFQSRRNLDATVRIVRLQIVTLRLELVEAEGVNEDSQRRRANTRRLSNSNENGLQKEAAVNPRI
jgi:hypothetical protein